MTGTYDPAEHDRALVCPKCKAENAPANTDEYTGVCHDCGFEFEAPVSAGDRVTVPVEDIHESGRGVGRLDSGFVVLVSGVLPASDDDVVKEADVTIKRVMDNYAEADTVHETTEVEVEDDEEDEDDALDADDEDGESAGRLSDEPALGRRDDYWG